MPYVKLSTRSPRYTYLRKSLIRGITTRQWKTCRKYIKRHRTDFGSVSTRRLMAYEPGVIKLAAMIAPRKNNWLV